MNSKLVMIGLLVAATGIGFRTWADEVVVKNGETEARLQGEIVIEAQDLSLLFRSRDGRLWILQPDQIVQKIKDDQPVEPMTQKEISDQLLKELPEGFRIYQTKNFVVAYQNEKAYARWVGGAYERLLKGFKKYWEKDKKFKLSEPRFPMVAIVFGTKAAYLQYVTRELGSDQGNMVAYYNLMTNRVAMYDLTADQLAPNQQIENDRKINQILSNRNSLPMVATVIHEGTHQLMFNCGMQTRFSDTPLWINEGLAMYFETPDMNSSRGWRAIGKVNYLRLNQFRADLNTRPANSLTRLISVDGQFTDPQLGLSAYAEAWAFNYFLLNKHSDEYVQYLTFMSQKKPLKYDTPDQRLKDFQKFFGDDLNGLDREFVGYMRRLK